MWINREVDIPEEVLTAQRAGKLVVFAGAGISMGHPSKLPGFEELALRIAGAGISMKRKEPADQFLGRVESRPTDIQSLARSIIDDPRSRVCELHQGLCSLFRSANDLRVITTNFDRHLTTALSSQLNGASVPIYYGPAVPLGREFSGLVYLHGAVERKESHLVLSDSDFGRAYLTDGWATRFLFDVFRNYTVLFVGYSHRDPVMSYIARGLSPNGSSRFAFVQAGDVGHWDYLNITPINYPSGKGKKKHGSLTRAVTDWVRDCKMGVLEHQHRIKRLTELPPPHEVDDLDYILAAFREAVRLRIFIANASGQKWLEWVAGRGLLESLFDPNAILDDCGHLLAQWLTHQYSISLPQPLFDLIQDKKGRLCVEFWFEIVRHLALDDPAPTPDLLSKWIVILVQSARPEWQHHFTDRLFARLQHNHPAKLLLFRYLAWPRAKLGRRWFDSDDPEAPVSINVDIHTVGKQHDLSDAWEAHLKSELPSLYPQLSTLLPSMLDAARELLEASGQAGAEWDGTSVGRSAIEPHGQDRGYDDMDVIIDATRDLLEWTLLNKYHLGIGLRDLWLDSATPLLQRIGVHGLTKDQQLKPDDALRILLEKGWLYHFAVKHEVFILIKSVFRNATVEARKQFIQAAETGSATPGSDESARNTRDYERYNMAVWLHDVAPECDLSRNFLKRMQEANPSFGPREYPDLSSWSGGVFSVAHTSPLTPEKLLEANPLDIVDWIVAYHGDPHEIIGDSRSGLMLALREAVSQRWDWGKSLLSVLQTKHLWSQDVWEAIVDGAASAAHSSPEWRSIVDTLGSVDFVLSNCGSELMGLLEKVVSDEREDVDEDLVLKCITVGRAVYEFRDYADTVGGTGEKDWVLLALNHPGGKAATIAIQGTSALQKAGQTKTIVFPSEIREWIEVMAQGKDVNSQRARTILAGNFHFFFSLDRSWADQILLPLFDWEIDEQRATQVWAGYLGWGRWNDATLEALLPSLRGSFSRITQSGDLLRRLAGRLAGFAVYGARDPWHDGWLVSFINDTSDMGLNEWAVAMSETLGELTPPAIQTAWLRWIKDYWEDRIHGIPRPFGGEESWSMLDWIDPLKSVFAEVVGLIGRQTLVRPDHSGFLYTLSESPLLEEHASDAARLVGYLLADPKQLGYNCGHVTDIVKKLNQAKLDKRDLRSIVERMAALGCANAMNLEAELGLN